MIAQEQFFAETTRKVKVENTIIQKNSIISKTNSKMSSFDLAVFQLNFFQQLVLE